MKDVMLTLIGPDATGIVARTAAIVEARGGNWLDSRMIRLGGYFSGILRISIPEASLAAFGEEVETFLKGEGFQVAIQPAEIVAGESKGAAARLELSGQDHPGIVHAIFSAFRESGVNVEELSTGLQVAPWSGTPVFEAKASLRIPEGVSLDVLQANLENLASDLLVEVGFKRD
ncbi:MAG: glycine cleavage system protein R [Puniceicoccaceae bacterium]